jgi:hypothetical protein
MNHGRDTTPGRIAQEGKIKKCKTRRIAEDGKIKKCKTETGQFE